MVSRATCQVIAGSARPNSFASSPTVRSASAPLPSEARVPTAPPNCACSTRFLISFSRSAWRSNIDSHTAAL